MNQNCIAKLPRNCHGQDLIKVLRKIGFKFCNIKGSHYVMVKIDCNFPMILTVPLHNPLRVGTLLGTIRKAGLTNEEFVRLYKGKK